MIKNLLVLLGLVGTLHVAGQESFTVSFGGGVSQSSSALKDQAQVGNGYHLQADAFMPFFRKGWDGSVKGSGKFALGIIAGGSYTNAKNLQPNVSSAQDRYKLYNGNLNIRNEESASSANPGYTVAAGLQANISFGRLSISPAFSAGYYSVTRHGFAQKGMIDSKPITLTESPETSSAGFISIPQIRIGYKFTEQLGIYAGASLPTGAKINTVQRHLVPAGGFNDKNTYEPMQLSSGRLVDQSVAATYSILNVNAGVSWSFPQRSRRLKGKVTKPGDNGAKTVNPLYNPSGNSGQNPMHKSALAKPGNPIGGIIVKGGKNPGGSLRTLTSNNDGVFELPGLETGHYKFTLSTSQEPAQKDPDETANETAPAARPGQPIGGIVVKGGKNPGGNMTNLTLGNNGTIEFEVLEAGDYKFIIQTPESAGKKKPKVEKATSGLKDTLKTNV